MFQNFDTLGFMNPFYINYGEKIVISHNPNSLYKLLDKLHIDPVALIEMLNYQYFFGDRTLIQGINKTPFMAKPSEDFRDWTFEDVPMHNTIKFPSEKEVAKEFYNKLRNEIQNYCGNSKVVGLLLSGGMDSRIVAGVLDNLIKEKELNCNVIAITWGSSDSRDVVYAKKIAKVLKWEWVHFDLIPEDLLKNIDIAASRGCEYAPNHLHAIPKVAELIGIDCILAGSYGDSIGRGEYSGTHFTKLKPLGSKVSNKFNVLASKVYNEYKSKIKIDIDYYNKKIPRENEFEIYELQRQIHYMRRMLNPCMNVINEKIPLHQVFTTPKTFGFMWSLDKKLRNDYVYYHMIRFFDKEIQDIPWSRTGKKYMENNSDVKDNFNKSHSYGHWIRNDLFNDLKKRILSSNIERLNIFNMDALESLVKCNKITASDEKHNRADEIIIWLAALSKFVSNKIIVPNSVDEKKTKVDKLNSQILTGANVFIYNKGRKYLKK